MLLSAKKLLMFFLFAHKNICCRYSLEAPWKGASNEYPQHMFSWRNKKNISLIPLLSGIINIILSGWESVIRNCSASVFCFLTTPKGVDNLNVCNCSDALMKGHG